MTDGFSLKRSEEFFRRAEKVIPGGVNSPVRAFGAVGGTPPFISKAKGSKIYDADGNEYIDYVCSWGPLILGHAHPVVVAAIKDAAEKGSSFGAPTENEILLAEKIVEAVPSIEKVRLVSSGTEATMSAVRLARAATGRDKIVKFTGCYHGHADSFLVQAGSGALTFGEPSSPGVPRSVTNDTLVAPYNDLDSLDEVLSENNGEIAAIIVEPVAANMGCVPPKEGFLAGLRERCDIDGMTLIFDEVITGFRIAFGGAQELYDVMPDITTLGKIIGGGLPVGAYGGKAELMDMIAPIGAVYQAGTLSGNPLATSAGLAVLNELSKPGTYEKLEMRSSELEIGLKDAIESLKVKAIVQRVGSLLCMYFSDGPIEKLEDIPDSISERYKRYFHFMLETGVYLAPSAYEAMFISLAHSSDDIESTIKKSILAFEKLS
ncbi:MAG: glutamate-1-semialdehyde 2,1-aminomutase [Candidatus Marinimicrobia bacterium]|nr:glutamate-1-semialdehyde 2,1-aminomutase [Candidatus Neomarinimicrobiota bacterium]